MSKTKPITMSTKDGKCLWHPNLCRDDDPWEMICDHCLEMWAKEKKDVLRS